MNKLSIAHQERAASYKRVAKKAWALFVFGAIFTTAWFFYLTTKVPPFQKLENPKINLASEIISSDDKLLGRYYVEKRLPVRYNELSPHLVEALIATEDERYIEHAGVDSRALGRVLYRTLLLGKSSGGGGSTISQQLAKLLYGRVDMTKMNILQKAFTIVNIKLKEWITAIKLERSYTKEEIIAMYLNNVDFLHGADGIRSAAEIYFGTIPKDLTLEEAAMLIGMLKNPSLYNPKNKPKIATKRREVVLFQMKRQNKLSQTAYDSLRVLPLDMGKFNRVDHNDGLAPYFREHLRQELKKILADVKRPDGKSYDIYRDGLKVYTTIDARIQGYAEQSVRKHMIKMQPKFFKHWKKKDPWTHRGTNTTKAEIDRRKKSLKKLVEQSDRYKQLRKTRLQKCKELALRDVDIKRMLIAEETPSKIDKWKKTGFISTKLEKQYKKILKSKDWAIVKKEWNTFQSKIKTVFDKPVKMKVFAYNTQGETDTLMSPLDSIKYHRMFLQTGVMAIEPATGHIKAWVGGINHKRFKYDHVNRSASRQVGSTFKPFLYALSIEQRGYSPCYQVPDVPITIEAGSFGLRDSWTPRNSSGDYSGEMYTLQRGLKESKNSISTYLMKELGSTEPLRELVANMGIDTARINPNDPYSYRVPKQPSICLGATDLSVFEMTGAYGAFANEGIYRTPVFITHIEDKNGNKIYRSLSESRKVLSDQANYVMLDMLKKVMSGALGFYDIKSEIGGKTGTTNYHADAWFMGLTPNLVVGTWVGGDDRWIRFREMRYGQGSRLARPIFSSLLHKLEKDKSGVFDVTARFKKPARELEIELDCWMYEQQQKMGPTEGDPDGFFSGDRGTSPTPEDEGLDFEAM